MLKGHCLPANAPVSLIAAHCVQKVHIAEHACSPGERTGLVKASCTSRTRRDLLLELILAEILMDRVQLLVIEIDLLRDVCIEARVALLVLAVSLHLQQVSVLA